MSIPESYVVNPGTLARLLSSIQDAGVPERFTFEFMKTMGFKNNNDRKIIAVLKGIGFLDENGRPTDAYKAFRNKAQGPKILAKAITSAYAPIFLANTKAEKLSPKDAQDIIATLTSKGERAVKEISTTFTTLCKLADFSSARIPATPNDPPVQKPDTQLPPQIPPTPPLNSNTLDFRYNIQIHLPTTTDVTVYNAIFKSLRENLL